MEAFAPALGLAVILAFVGFGQWLRQQRRIFCKPCLDWSERRPHLAGAVGAALARQLFALGWIERMRDTRALRITPVGRQGLQKSFDWGPSAESEVRQRAAS